MRRLVLLLAAASACSSCRRAAPPLAPGALKTAVQSAKAQPPCSTVIPDEWAYSWPVPLADPEASRFTVLYYPVTGHPGAPPTVWSPAGEGVVDARSGKPVSCALLPGAPKELSRRRWPAASEAWDIKTFRAREGLVFEKTQEIAAIYDARRQLRPADVDSAKSYFEAFSSLAEPDLLPYYYRMNPDFWEWLRSAAGVSIPKAF